MKNIGGYPIFIEKPSSRRN